MLNRIARNLLIDRYRRTSPHLVPLDSARELHDPAQDPTEEVARRQRRRAVHHAIGALPTRHQSAIKYSLSGMTPEEVGKQLGIGRNAADALLHRARRSLKEHLSPVRDGMWGLALAIRVRYDRVVRRAGLGGTAGDASSAFASSVAAGIATAVVVVAMSVGGGGGNGTTGSIGGPGRTSDVRVGVTAPAQGTDGADAATSLTGGVTGGDATSGGSSSNSFTFGPTTTSGGPHGVSNDISIPDPTNKNGPPLLQISQWIWNDDRGAPPPDDQQSVLSRTLCGLGSLTCLGGS